MVRNLEIRIKIETTDNVLDNDGILKNARMRAVEGEECNFKSGSL